MKTYWRKYGKHTHKNAQGLQAKRGKLNTSIKSPTKTTDKKKKIFFNYFKKMERMGKCNKKILEIGIQKVEQAGRRTLRQLEEAKNLHCLHCRVFTAQALVVTSTDDVEMSSLLGKQGTAKTRIG